MKNIESNEFTSIQFDTSKTTILSFDRMQNYPFDSSYNRAFLNQSDLISIDNILNDCLTVYNKRFEKKYKEFTIDYKKGHYRKQIIAVTNKKGEKEVWLNCFCYDWGSDKWKTQILSVDDGGKCYFNLKINLATQKFYDFYVNGEA